MPNPSFDPKIFLAREGPGRKLLHYKDRQAIFAQGEAAGCVLYVQKGRVKLAVTTPGGKEAVVGLLDRGTSSATNAWPGKNDALPPPSAWGSVPSPASKKPP